MRRASPRRRPDAGSRRARCRPTSIAGRGAGFAAHPAQALRLSLRKIALVLNRADVPLNYSYAYYRRDEPTLLRALAVGPWLLVPLGLVGFVLGGRAAAPRPAGYWIWASFVPVYGLSVAAFFVSDRYRMPLLVPLCVSTAALLVWAIDRLRERRVRPLLAAAVPVVGLAVLAGWPSGLDDGRGGEQTRQAVWLVEQGAYGKAVRYVDAISSRHSHPGVLHFRVGEALTGAGRYDAAVAQLTEARRIDGPRPAIQLALGQALLLAGRAKEAVPPLSRAVQAPFRPEVSGPWLVRALVSAGRQDEAVRLLRTLFGEIGRRVPTDTALEMGTVGLEAGAAGEAERWLRASVGQAPDNAEAQEQLAVALVVLGRPADALGPIETACRLRPSSASARLNLAVVYAQLGRRDDARAQAEEAARLDPTEPRAAALLRALAPRERR